MLGLIHATGSFQYINTTPLNGRAMQGYLTPVPLGPPPPCQNRNVNPLPPQMLQGATLGNESVGWVNPLQYAYSYLPPPGYPPPSGCQVMQARGEQQIHVSTNSFTSQTTSTVCGMLSLCSYLSLVN